MKNLGTRITLAVSGAILVIIGSWIMAAPVIFLATSQVLVENDAGLISEITAPSCLLLIAGAFMIMSAIKAQLASVGLAAGAIVYGSFGFSRLISTYLHGTPSDSLVVVMYFELTVAVLLLSLNFKIQSAERSKALDVLKQEMSQ